MTILETVISATLLFLLVGMVTFTLTSFGSTLRGLELEGDQLARAAHATEHLQRELLRSDALEVGTYTLGSRPLRLSLGGKATRSVTLDSGFVSWDGLRQAPASSVNLRVWIKQGHRYIQIDWQLAPPLPMIRSVFDATVQP